MMTAEIHMGTAERRLVDQGQNSACDHSGSLAA